MVVAPTESLGGQEEDLAEPAVSLTDQPPPVIDRTALMPPGEQPGTTGDHPCRGVVDDRPQFTGQFRGQHHVDSSQCQESHVGVLNHGRSQFSFTRMNILFFRNAIPVQLSQEASIRRYPLGRAREHPGPRPGSESGWIAGLARPGGPPVRRARGAPPRGWPGESRYGAPGITNAMPDLKTSSKHRPYPGRQDSRCSRIWQRS